MINNKWFTLIEVLVSIMIMGTLLALAEWLFTSIKNNSIKKLTIADVNWLNDYINNIKLADYYIPASEDIDELDTLNQINKDELTDIYYSVQTISPVVINLFDFPLKSISGSLVGDSDNPISDLVLWLQKCNYLFDHSWNTIKWKKFIKEFESPYKLWEAINLQWFLLFNWELPTFEKVNYYYNNNWYFWYNYYIEHLWNELYSSWNKTAFYNDTDYLLYDILYDQPNLISNNNFFIYSIKSIDWNIENGIYLWTENNFTNEIINKYITWINNDSILNSGDINLDKEERKNLSLSSYDNIQILYNNSQNFKTSFEEILFIWLKENENY